MNVADNSNDTGSQRLTLQLNTIPSSWHGYQYRCLVNNAYSSRFVLKVRNVWVGTAGAACATLFFSNCFIICKNIEHDIRGEGSYYDTACTEFPQQVSTAIQSWKDITAATHWDLYDRTKPDGADFYIGQNELGHIHLDGEIHLAIGKELAEVLIKNKLGKKFPWGNDWVTSPIKSAQDVAHAVWLFKLGYDRIKGIPMEKLVAEIDGYK